MTSPKVCLLDGWPQYHCIDLVPDLAPEERISKVTSGVMVSSFLHLGNL